MAGLDPAIQSNLKYLVFFWMAASQGGHDDGFGGNIWVIKSRNDACVVSGIAKGVSFGATIIGRPRPIKGGDPSRAQPVRYTSCKLRRHSKQTVAAQIMH